LQVTVDNSQITKALKDVLGKTLDKHLKVADDKIGQQLIKYAKTHHRHTTQTGRLNSSLRTTGSTADKGLTFEANDIVCNYATYVIKGHRSWRADPFIEAAVKANETFINKTIQQAIDNSVAEVNRG